MLKNRYKVVHVHKTVVEGTVEIENEPVHYRRKAVILEAVPADIADQSGTMKIVATGDAILEAEKFAPDDIIVVSVEKE